MIGGEVQTMVVHVHTTPDGEVPKIIQIEGGYESGIGIL